MKTLKLRHPLWGCKLSQKSFPDINLTTLDGCGKVVGGHRVLLASVSSKLAGLFNEQKKGVVMVRNVRFSHLENVVNFLYTGSVCVGGEGDFTEEDLHDVLNLLQVNKEELGEIEGSENLPQEMEYTELGDSFGGRVSECVNGNMFSEEDNNFSPSSTGKMYWRPNENEDVDTSELSNNNVSVANSVKSVDENVREDFRRRLNSKQELPDDCKTGHNLQKKNKENMWSSKRRSVMVHCTYCLQKVKYPELRSHCKTLHPESPFDVQIKCEKCPSSLAVSQVSMHFHEQIFHPQVGAEDCLKSSPKEFITEKEKVIGKSIIKCEFCDTEVCFDNYFQHCRIHHRKSQHKVKWTEKVECPACKNKNAKGIYVSRACLPLHMKTYHGDQTGEAGEESYGLGLNSDISTKILKIAKKKTQKRIDGTLIPCEFCPNKKVRYFSYQKHCKKFHVEVPQESKECSVCNRRVFKYNLKYHNQLYHPGTISGYLNSVTDDQQDEEVNHEPKLKDEASLNSLCEVSKEVQNISPFRIFFTYKGLMKKSFVCVNYHTKVSVLFEKFISSLEVDMKTLNREQVVFRCRKVNLTGFESVGNFHNKTVEVFLV